MEFNIKKVETTDLDILQDISRVTFSETFAEVNSAENMAKYLDEKLSLTQLAAELNHTGSAFYFALVNGVVTGYLKLNFGAAQTENNNPQAMEIERIYVLKEFHGQKIGQLLFEHAVTVATQNQVDEIWLGVWEENHRALSFYKKNGFVVFDTHIFKLGDDVQTDLMMKKSLSDNFKSESL